MSIHDSLMRLAEDEGKFHAIEEAGKLQSALQTMLEWGTEKEANKAGKLISEVNRAIIDIVNRI